MSPRAPDEPVRLNRIYTRGGDKGKTSLGDGDLENEVARLRHHDRIGRAAGRV
jgi:cob(I)alamin adenosyltransferase